MQLKESLTWIEKHYSELWNGYFAAVSKDVFWELFLRNNKPGQLDLDIS